jgi:hypothetical protein
MFRHGVGWFLDVPTDYERYLDMFRRGYWQCIENYAEDINYINKPSDFMASGWGSEVSGYADGYKAAERDMQKNIKRFGKDRTAKYLISIWQEGG